LIQNAVNSFSTIAVPPPPNYVRLNELHREYLAAFSCQTPQSLRDASNIAGQNDRVMLGSAMPRRWTGFEQRIV